MSDRTHSTQPTPEELQRHLVAFFGELPADVLRDLEGELEWVSLRGGEVLFEEDDPGDCAYVVITGRLRAVLDESGRERVLNEMGAGETIGEMSLLSDVSRSATVYAVRDTQLARLSRSAFDRLTGAHPPVLRSIAGVLVDRLRRQSLRTRPAAEARTFALLPSSDRSELEEVARGLSGEFGRLGPRVETVDRARVEAALGVPGIADAPLDCADGIRVTEWLSTCEAHNQYVLFVLEPRWSAWNERALRHADQVVMLLRSEEGPELTDVEIRARELFSNARAPETILVLVHPSGERPRATARWMEHRPVHQHYHVDSGSPSDLARVVRLMTGRAIGLVLGGGGARGFAHLGVLRALEELAVPVDLIGGTSMGGILAALTAQGHGPDESLALCRKHFSSLFDPTLPVVSLLAGRRIGKRLEEVFRDDAIEDTLIPFFCVATNLSRAEEVVHRRGPLLRAVRSSISLPGILPPVTLGGDLYVDGGLLNNLPIDVMRRFTRGGPVVAVDVSPEQDVKTDLELATEISGWRVLLARLNPFARSSDVPYISTVLLRSAVVGSIVKARSLHESAHASLCLRVPVHDFGLLEFSAMEAIAERGYQSSLETLSRWWDELRKDRGA